MLARQRCNQIIINPNLNFVLKPNIQVRFSGRTKVKLFSQPYRRKIFWTVELPVLCVFAKEMLLIGEQVCNSSVVFHISGDTAKEKNKYIFEFPLSYFVDYGSGHPRAVVRQFHKYGLERICNSHYGNGAPAMFIY